jgi:hypothetical protein
MRKDTIDAALRLGWGLGRKRSERIPCHCLRTWDELRTVRFPRCTMPLEENFKEPIQMVWGWVKGRLICTWGWFMSGGKERMVI